MSKYDVLRAALTVLEVAENERMPLTTSQKQEAFRARKAMLGYTEVRGIYLPPELHKALREAAKVLLEKHRPERSSQVDGPK